MLRTGLACGLLGAAALVAWPAAPRPQRQQAVTPHLITLAPPVQVETAARAQPASRVRLVSTREALATTSVQIDVIEPELLARALADRAPCYSLVRMASTQRLIYSCR